MKSISRRYIIEATGIFLRYGVSHFGAVYFGIVLCSGQEVYGAQTRSILIVAALEKPVHIYGSALPSREVVGLHEYPDHLVLNPVFTCKRIATDVHGTAVIIAKVNGTGIQKGIFGVLDPFGFAFYQLKFQDFDNIEFDAIL